MLKLESLESKKIWGYEKWICSVHPALPQKEFACACKDFPLLVKIIQADDKLSVQVHPDDEMAVVLEGEGSRGKTECWYVLDALPDAKIVYGLKESADKSVLKSLLSGENSSDSEKISDYLNVVPVKKGDFIFIPSGKLHAIGSGLRLLEVQQSCDITYRFYDWGRPREIHVEKALKSLKLNEKNEHIVPFSGNFECEYFSLSKIEVKGGWAFMNSSSNKYPVLVYVIDSEDKGIATKYFGSKLKDSKTGELYQLEKEQIYAVFPGEKISIEGKCSVMKIVASD